MLKKLVINSDGVFNAVTFKCIILSRLFGFFPFASLLPHAIMKSLVKDIVWTVAGFQIILKCAKICRDPKENKVMQIPKLQNLDICPVPASKAMIVVLNLKQPDPLFMIQNSGGKTILTPPNVRKFFATAIESLALNPRDFGLAS